MDGHRDGLTDWLTTDQRTDGHTDGLTDWQTDWRKQTNDKVKSYEQLYCFLNITSLFTVLRIVTERPIARSYSLEDTRVAQRKELQGLQGKKKYVECSGCYPHSAATCMVIPSCHEQHISLPYCKPYVNLVLRIPGSVTLGIIFVSVYLRPLVLEKARHLWFLKNHSLIYLFIGTSPINSSPSAMTACMFHSDVIPHYPKLVG